MAASSEEKWFWGKLLVELCHCYCHQTVVGVVSGVISGEVDLGEGVGQG